LFELAVAIAAPWVGAAIADWQSTSASTRTTRTFAILFIAILPAPLTACSLPDDPRPVPESNGDANLVTDLGQFGSSY
jgi:hypothetical protein